MSQDKLRLKVRKPVVIIRRLEHRAEIFYNPFGGFDLRIRYKLRAMVETDPKEPFITKEEAKSHAIEWINNRCLKLKS